MSKHLRHPPRYALLFFTALLLTACASSPVILQQYVLSSASVQPMDVSPGAPTIELKRVMLPDYLQSRGLVMQREDGTLSKASLHVWAQPLDQDIGAAIVQRINQSGQFNAFYTGVYSHPLNNTHASISLHIEHFIVMESGDVVLSGYWYNSNDSDSPRMNRFQFRSELSDDGYAPAVNEMRKLLDEMTDSLIAELALGKQGTAL